MKIGKLSENVLKRSVLKEIKYRNENVVSGATVGTDCAIFAFDDGADLVTTTNVVTEDVPGKGSLAIHTAVNNLVVAGAKPLAVEVGLLFPGQSNEEELKLLVREMNKTCELLGVPLIGGHTEITRAVKWPVITVTGMGRKEATKTIDKKFDKHIAYDIVVTKWVGLAGSYIVARKMEEELRKRFPLNLIDEAKAFDKFLSIVPEAATAVKSNVKAMHDISKGGILGALWEMAERFGIGLEVDLKKIPIRQETVEICNHLDLNPYELLSTGSMLLLAENGQEVVDLLAEQNINSEVVGRTTDSNDRLVWVDDESRFLTRPGTDELLKIYSRKDEREMN